MEAPAKPGRQFPGVGTGAVIIQDHPQLGYVPSMLMVYRQGAHGAGTWSVPGGWVDFWEDPMRGAEREVMEECGIVVQALAPRGWTNEFHEDSGERIQAVTLWVECEHVSGTIKVMEPEKCPRVEWVPLRDVTQRPLFQPLATWFTTDGPGGPQPNRWRSRY